MRDAHLNIINKKFKDTISNKYLLNDNSKNVFDFKIWYILLLLKYNSIVDKSDIPSVKRIKLIIINIIDENDSDIIEFLLLNPLVDKTLLNSSFIMDTSNGNKNEAIKVLLKADRK